MQPVSTADCDLLCPATTSGEWAAPDQLSLDGWGQVAGSPRSSDSFISGSGQHSFARSGLFSRHLGGIRCVVFVARITMDQPSGAGGVGGGAGVVDS